MTRRTIMDRALRPVATELIHLFGKQVQIKREARTPRPGMGDVSANSQSTQTVLAYVANRDAGFATSSGSVEDAVLEAWVDHASLEWTPDPGDLFILGTSEATDQVYSIIAVSEVFSGEQIAIVKIDLGL